MPAPGAWTSDADCTGIQWSGRFGPGHGNDCVIEVTGSTPDVHGLEYHYGVIPISGGPAWPFPGVETPDVLPAGHGPVTQLDLTGDGFEDLVVSYARPSIGLVYMLLQSQAGGTFLAPSLASDAGFTPAPRALLFTDGERGDFNNDSKNDMFFVSQFPDKSGHLYWYTMSYAGAEVVTFNESDSNVNVDPCSTVTLGDSLVRSYVDNNSTVHEPHLSNPYADFNLDGNTDQIVIVQSESTGVRFLIAAGAGDGTFSHTIEVPLLGGSPLPSAIDAGNDDIPDLQIGFTSPDGKGSSMILYGDGAFNFSPTPP